MRRALIPALAALAAFCGLAAGDRPADPLAEAIARNWASARTRVDSSETWQGIRGSSVPAYERASQALKDGRRLLALNRYASARLNPAAYEFSAAHPKSMLTDTTGFARWWVRERDSLAAMLPGVRAASRGRAAATPEARVREIRPAAIRAMAEIAIPQVRNYYDAALDYGYSTQPEYGIYYVGVARAQRDFFALCEAVGTVDAGREPPFRALDSELDALHAEVLAAYRGPVSIDRHPEFIQVSSVIKEARELNAAGLRRGALHRYLQAVQRFAPLRPTPSSLDSATLATRLAEYERRVKGGGDHTIGEFQLQLARAELAAAPAGQVAPIAVAVVADVMPRYFAALEPARPVAARPRAQATVTLVRWPYT